MIAAIMVILSLACIALFVMWRVALEDIEFLKDRCDGLQKIVDTKAPSLLDLVERLKNEQ